MFRFPLILRHRLPNTSRLIFNFSFSHRLAFATKPPKWPDVYSVSGMLTIPYAEINEPFYAWYDKTNGRSRVDYYGGMVKTYQLTKQGDYGVSLKLAPVTTQNQMNKETCLQVNGSASYKIDVQGILPYVRDFQLLGKLAPSIGGDSTDRDQRMDRSRS